MNHSSDISLRNSSGQVWSAALVVWLIGMCVLPDPRPLGAPSWAIRLAQSTGISSEPKARIAATVVLRTLGLAAIGILLALALQKSSMTWRALAVLLGTPILGIGVKWANFGYFPIWSQLIFILVVSVLSGLAGLALLRSRLAAIALVAACGVLVTWAASTSVPADLEQASRATGQYLLANSEELVSGDAAFFQLLEMAFAYAEENSHGSDAVFANKAAILALGVIMGDDQLVRIGRTELDPNNKAEREALRRRVTIHGRGDLPRHFAVSAALTVLTDETRALAVGIAKEASDSNPGGSGFSFVDMVANKSGIRLAGLATRNMESARMLQMRMLQTANQFQYIPAIDGLPEGLSSDELQTVYGGLGGAKTRELLAEIDRRIDSCDGLQSSQR